MKRRDPRTMNEWQEAVDAAHGALALDSARIYGLVAGGPDVDVDRCSEILKKGKAMGIRPKPDAVERFAIGVVEEMAAAKRGARK